MAGLQRAGAGGGGQFGPSGAGAAALPVHLGGQSGRVLHDPGGGAEGAGASAAAGGLARRPDARGDAGAGQRRRQRADGRAAGLLARDAQGHGRDRAGDRRAGRHHAAGARTAGAGVPQPAVRRADAPGHRSGAPVSLPAQPGLLAGAEAASPAGQPHPLRPCARADPGAALLGPVDRWAVKEEASLHHPREPADPVHRPSVPRLRGAGEGRAAPDPRFRHRDRGGGRGSGHRVRGGAEATPPGRRGADQDRGVHAGRPARLHHRGAERGAPGRGADRWHAGAGAAVRTDSRRPSRAQVPRL